MSDWRAEAADNLVAASVVMTHEAYLALPEFGEAEPDTICRYPDLDNVICIFSVENSSGSRMVETHHVTLCW